MIANVIIAVAGLGRCGTSLTLQMLQAGGVPCVGTFPAFEGDPGDYFPIRPAFWDQCVGKAVKVLDPHEAKPPTNHTLVVLWLDRNPREQARSQAKFMQLMLGLPVSRTMTRAIQGKLAADRKASHAALRQAPVEGFKAFYFEDMLISPRGAARSISEFLTPWTGPLDVAAMAARVVRRAPTCRADLAIEAHLVDQAEAG